MMFATLALLAVVLAQPGKLPPRDPYALTAAQSRSLSQTLARIHVKPWTVAEYDAKYEAMLQQARLAHDPHAARTAMRRTETARMMDYPTPMSSAAKRHLYGWELLSIGDARRDYFRAEAGKVFERMQAGQR